MQQICAARAEARDKQTANEPTPAPTVSNCKDDLNWNVWGMGCRDFAEKIGCDLNPFDYYDFGDFDWYADWYNPATSCCHSCSIVSQSPKEDAYFDQIKAEDIGSSKNGTQVTIWINKPHVRWSEIRIKSFQNIVVIGNISNGQRVPILDAKYDGRHFSIERDATL